MKIDLNKSLVRECWGGNAGGVSALLRAGADVKKAGWALTVAASCGHDLAVRLLIAAGVDLHYDNDAPLEAAVSNGKLETVRTLLSLGANPNACTPEVLNQANQLGHKAAVREVKRWQQKLLKNGPAPGP